MSYFIAISLSLILILGGFIAGYLLGNEKDKELNINIRIEKPAIENSYTYKLNNYKEPLAVVNKYQQNAYLRHLPAEERKFLPIDIEA